MKKLIFLILCAVSGQSMAERLFDVEVIVFKRNLNPERVKEQWSNKQPRINVSNAVSFRDSKRLEEKEIFLLPKSEWQLTDQYNTLEKHAGFTPLLHTAWRQDDRGRIDLPKIRFHSKKDFSESYHQDGTAKMSQHQFGDTAFNDAHVPPPDIYGVQPLLEFDGYIRLYVQHYLFLETNLVLRIPGERKKLSDVQEFSPPQNSDLELTSSDNIENSTPEQVYSDNISIGSEQLALTEYQPLKPTYIVEKFLKPYTFKHKRRMRSGEIHYLDHPLIGLIIQVTRVKE